MANDDQSDLTLGDQLRTTRAITELLQHLALDPNVKTAWMRWAAHRGITPAALDAPDLNRLRALARGDGDDERARFAEMVRGELGLPFSWAPAVLHRTFQKWVEDFAGQRPRRIPSFWPDPDALATLPPKEDLRDSFRRDVEWYYRARVKRPPDKPGKILRAYKKADAADHAQAGYALVTHAIKRAHKWLNGPLPPIPWDEP